MLQAPSFYLSFIEFFTNSCGYLLRNYLILNFANYLVTTTPCYKSPIRRFENTICKTFEGKKSILIYFQSYPNVEFCNLAIEHTIFSYIEIFWGHYKYLRDHLYKLNHLSKICIIKGTQMLILVISALRWLISNFGEFSKLLWKPWEALRGPFEKNKWICDQNEFLFCFPRPFKIYYILYEFQLFEGCDHDQHVLDKNTILCHVYIDI